MSNESTNWEVRGRNIDGEQAVLNWGTSEQSFPDARLRKALRADGHKIYMNGKIYKEPENVKKAKEPDPAHK